MENNEKIKQADITNNQATKLTRKQQVIQLLKFIAFSLSAGVWQILTFELLYNWTSCLPWWPSYLISIVISVVWNFTFNRKFTFKSANNVPIAMAWTLLYYVAFVPVSVFGGNALEDIGWNGTLVTFIMMVINFVTEFLWQRFFVFRKSINTKPLPKTVEMKLSASAFKRFVEGEKSVEMRINDEKRKQLKEGDHIVFKNRDEENQSFKAKITKIVHFDSFEKLYQAYDKSALGYFDDEEAHPQDMRQYYSDEDTKDGVLAIEVKIYKKNNVKTKQK